MNQLAIYKRFRGFNLGLLRTNPDLNTERADYKSSILTAQPLCLHKEKIETFDCSINFLTVALLALRLQSATVNVLF